MMNQSATFQNFFSEVLNVLVSIIEERDVFFRGHGKRVASISSAFAQRMSLPQKTREVLYVAGLLHDIGMVYVPFDIINRPGELGEEERIIIHQHPVIAEKLLSSISIFKEILPVIRHHHECFDGKGYPDGLRGDKIPIEAQILSLADCYDAMTASRPYRPALTLDEALQVISDNNDNKFNKLLVNQFVSFVSSSSVKPVRKEDNKLRRAIVDIIKDFRRGNIDLPVLPRIIDELRQAIDDPNSSPDDIARVLEKDAVITLRLISVVNSPIYRGAEKTLSVRQAVNRLGLKETQSIVFAIANKNLYRTDDKHLMTMMEAMWLHALACAFCAKHIAQVLRFADVEKSFLQGLFHDIGKLLLIHAITKAKSSVGTKTWEKDKSELIAAVQEAHMSMGGAILERWGFQEGFIKVATLHENAKFATGTDEAVLVVHLANMMTRKMGYSLYNDNEIDLSGLESVKTLKISSQDMSMIMEEVGSIMKSSIGAF